MVRYELAGKTRDRRGAVQLVFGVTLENRSNVAVGAVTLEAESLSTRFTVDQGRLEFPPIGAGARVASRRALRIDKARGRSIDIGALRFRMTSAAPELVATTPAGAGSTFPPSEWIVLEFRTVAGPDVRRGFALTCDGETVALAAHLLVDQRVVVNPNPDLPPNAACVLRWVGARARVTELAFLTGQNMGDASVRYDRSDLVKNNPLPDDFFTIADDTAATGLRVAIPVPMADRGTRLIVGALVAGANELDGFSPHGPIVLELSEPPAPESVPGLSSGASLDPLSPIMLLDLTPGSPQRGARIPLATHVRSDRVANGPLEHVLFVYPATQLRRAGRYGLVVSRRFGTGSARPFRLSPYLSAALADPTLGEDPGLPKLRPLVREVADAAASLDPPIPAEDLAFVLRFTVGSLPNSFTTPLAMREQVASLPPPAVTITRVSRSFDDDVVAFVEGRFEAPYWTDDSGVLVRDDSGDPAVQGIDQIPFLLALPYSATQARAPVVLHQHGWPGTSGEVRTQAGQELARAGFAVAGFTDSLNRYYGPNLGAQSTGIYLTLLRTHELPGFWMETLGQQLAFLRALEALSALDVLPLGAPDGVPDLDPSARFYTGVSGGATQGAMLLPYAPEIIAAHLAVGSGRLIETAVHQESPEGSNVLRSLGSAFPLMRPSELWSALHAFQMLFDWQEAQTHAARLYRDPIEVAGTIRKASILWAEGLNDSQSPPTARRAALHAMGLPLLTPVSDVVPILRVESTPASANVDEATTGGVFQYVPAGMPGLPPTPGCEREFEGHFCAVSARAAWLQRAAFFTSALSGPPIVFDPFNDVDDDGLSDLDEGSRGTDPAHPDSDRDAMPDGFEVTNRLDPLDADDAVRDGDRDGLTNRDEYEAGTSLRSGDTDRDGLSDGEETNGYGTNPTLADTDAGGRSDGQEVARDGTDPKLGSDDLPLRALPTHLVDGTGSRWTIMRTGGIPYGDCCEDGEEIRDFRIGTSLFPSLLDARVEDQGELALGPVVLEDVTVTRKVFVSPTEGFLRHVEILENRTASDVVASVRLIIDFNDDIAEASDDWIRSAGEEDDVIGVVFSDPAAPLQPSGTPSAVVPFAVPIRAGERAILVSFHVRNENAAEAQAAIEHILEHGESLFEGMSPEERAGVVNFLD